MSAQISCRTTALTKPQTAAKLIDDTLIAALTEVGSIGSLRSLRDVLLTFYITISAARRISRVSIARTVVSLHTQLKIATVVVPTNLVQSLISSEPLTNPLPPSASSPHPALLFDHPLPSPADPEALNAAVEAITKLYARAKNPVVLVDAIAERIGVEDLVIELVEATGMTVFVSPMGKGTIDERHPQFGGVSETLSVFIDSSTRGPN